MRYLILAMLCLISSVVSAQQVREVTRTVNCGEVKLIINSLMGEDIGEKPIWIGRTEETNTQTAVMVNVKTLSWTVIQYDTKTACVLSVGEGFKINFENQKIDKYQ